MESNRKDGQRKEEQRTGSYREDGVREEKTSFGKRGWEEYSGKNEAKNGDLGKKKALRRAPCLARRGARIWPCAAGVEVLVGAGAPVVALLATVHVTGLVDVVALEGERLACFPTSWNLPDVAVQAVGVGKARCVTASVASRAL